MSKYPISSVCPHCGSDESRSRGGQFRSYRVCQHCNTRYILPTTFWERALVATAFILPGLMFAAVAVVIFLVFTEKGPVDPGGLLCCALIGLLAFGCLGLGLRELLKGWPRVTSQRVPLDRFENAAREESRSWLAELPPLVPKELAESIVREIAEIHDAKGIVRRLGHFRPNHLAHAAARFAIEMKDDETLLAFLDTSWLQNGKAGLLLTNRGLYSSLLVWPIWLADIREVSYAQPGVGDILLSFTFIGKLRTLFKGSQYLQNRLLVNGKIAHATGNPLRGEFWIDLLLALADAAREANSSPHPQDVNAQLPSTVLELTVHCPEEQAAESRRYDNASWEQIEQSVRLLDGEACSSLRLWRGQPNQSLALDVLGGNGKYVLHEPGDAGWVYYDPNQGDEEVEVCTTGQGYRLPAYYVCTDLDRVLKIVRIFLERGAFE